MSVCVCGGGECAHRDKKRVPDALELDLQAFVSPMTWILTTEPGPLQAQQ